MTRTTAIRYGIPFGIALLASHASAWSKHHLLMPYVVGSLGEFERKRLAEPAPSPCEDADRATYQALAAELGLQGAISLPPSTTNLCPIGVKEGPPDTPLALLRIGDWADDPDRGMDQNLSDSLDPTNERKYMGGNTGVTSQGFRHMYFGGWKLLSPLASFQIPLHAIGQSPERVELLSQAALKFRKQGDRIWSARLAAWTMHFLQDLAQPFHSVQIPSLSMIPWSAIWTKSMGKPGQGAFARLVTESTRVVANYHFAYERWVSSRMLITGNPFDACIPTTPSPVEWDPKTGSPRELAHEVARRSLELGRELGRAQMDFFGRSLKWPGVDLPNGAGEPDYDALDRDPALADARKRLIDVTCRALANAVASSRLLMTWVLTR